MPRKEKNRSKKANYETIEVIRRLQIILNEGGSTVSIDKWEDLDCDLDLELMKYLE